MLARAENGSVNGKQKRGRNLQTGSKSAKVANLRLGWIFIPGTTSSGFALLVCEV
jgi:hypothetical protein